VADKELGIGDDGHSIQVFVRAYSRGDVVKTAKDLAKRIRDIPNRMKQESYSLPIMEAVRGVHESVGKNFDRQVDNRGAAWKPHGPITVKLYGEHPLLQYSGDMRAAAEGGPGVQYKQGHRSIHMGFVQRLVHRANLTSKGGPSVDARGPFIVPGRRFYYLHQDDRPELHKAVKAKLKPIMRRVIYGPGF
jgi:hypothetical protein